MTAPTLMERLKRARVVQVLIVYLGASWAVLQIADTLTEALSLPDWVSPVSIILLLVGLVIILATAWVQALPSTTAAEEAGERPTDWEIAPAAAVESLKRGRLPHLTWGRAIFGGVFALSMLFGGAGVYVVFTGGSSFMGPTEAGASDAADGIAILPFNVSGVDDEAFWGEGMVDLLSTNLDGMGGYRTIDARTVMARWRENIGDAASPDLRDALTAAGATGARYAVVGSSVGIGSELRLVAEIYDLSDGSEVGSGQVAGGEDDAMSLIDDLSLETMRVLLAGGGEDLATTRNLADLTTASLPALRAYLEGERHYRQAAFPQAVDAYERALEADSTFALALYRLSDTYGWLESVNSETAAELADRSVRFMDRLTVRNAVIVGASNALYILDLSIVPQLEAAVRKYPDDPEAWFMLGEAYLHLGEASGATDADALEAVLKAISLDPSFAPYYVHAIDMSMSVDDPEAARLYRDQYHELLGADGSSLNEEYDVAYDLLYGDEAAKAAAWRVFDALDDRSADILWGTFGFHHDDVPTLQAIALYMRQRTGRDGWNYGLVPFTLQSGQPAYGEAILRDSLAQGPSAHVVHYFNEFTGRADDLLDVVRTCEFSAACTIHAGALAAKEGDWDRHQAAIDHATEAAERFRGEGDVITSRTAQAIAEGLKGYGQFVRGEAAIARVTLEAAQGNTAAEADVWIRYWLGQVNEELGRSQDALKWYGLLMTTNLRAFAHYRRAQIAEEMGDNELARREWQLLSKNFGEAEPDHPWLPEISAAMARLGG